MPVTEIRQVTMTAVVEDIKPPARFLKDLLWPTEEPLETETIQIETTSRGRIAAPFIRKNGEALMVGRPTSSGYSVEAPNIRIKMPLSPSTLLYNREPGGLVFNPAAGSTASRLRRQIAKDLQTMNDDISNTEEYLCSAALQGVVTYSVADEANFQIDFSKPTANNITLSTFWNDATPANVRVLSNFETAKRVVADDGSPTITDVILGAEAHDQLLEMIQLADASSPLKQLLRMDYSISSGGTMDFTRGYTDGGAIYLGGLAGLNIWAYRNTVSLNGDDVNLVRPKYAEFVSRSNASQRVMYYGAIPDMQALQGRSYVGRRFAKSWETPDPSVYYGLVHSRPLPVPRRPGATVSMKVISG